MAVTKLVERCFISDLALVSSPGVACGFRYDSNHRDELGASFIKLYLAVHYSFCGNDITIMKQWSNSK